MSLEGKSYYTDKEFCEEMGIDRRTAKRWRDSRIIGYMLTPTGKIRYTQAHIDAYNRRCEEIAKKVTKQRRAA